jgi:hypothetical protein
MFRIDCSKGSKRGVQAIALCNYPTLLLKIAVNSFVLLSAQPVVLEGGETFV